MGVGVSIATFLKASGDANQKAFRERGMDIFWNNAFVLTYFFSYAL